MIDLHCHILPGIDDGARDLDDAVAMAAQAETDGIEAICATPHIRHDHDVRIGELAGHVEALQGELSRRGVAVRVLTGGEVAETALAGLDPDELAAVTLAGGSWILLEPAPGPLSGSLLEAIRHLSELGFWALVAHPERHPGPGAYEVLESAVAQGALVQGTAAFIVPGVDSPLGDLAAHGLVHVLGSDSHSALAGRPTRLSEGLQGLARVPGIQAHLEWVSQTAPRAIVAGEAIAPPFAASSGDRLDPDLGG